ncbi:hypothetical protein PAMC26577_01225 [Caballeronia sordidicola]|uniref:Uncharacterized protein n=1 Tax=Caballeronia sordidicola TaxID=196367 RepID=A0A242N7B0_CABSO|nr:hypothetical protein PAMC26577_01225 [Caballeronia sordidicola]
MHVRRRKNAKRAACQRLRLLAGRAFRTLTASCRNLGATVLKRGCASAVQAIAATRRAGAID